MKTKSRINWMGFFWFWLAVLGALLPGWYFYGWLSVNDWDLRGMMAAWNANMAAQGVLYDMAVTAIAALVFIITDGRRHRVPYWGVAALGCFWAVSLGLPLYFWLRARHQN